MRRHTTFWCLGAVYQSVFIQQGHFVLAPINQVGPLVAVDNVDILATKDCILSSSARDRVLSSFAIDYVLAIVPLDIILASASTTTSWRLLKANAATSAFYKRGPYAVRAAEYDVLPTLATDAICVF